MEIQVIAMSNPVHAFRTEVSGQIPLMQCRVSELWEAQCKPQEGKWRRSHQQIVNWSQTFSASSIEACPASTYFVRRRKEKVRKSGKQIWQRNLWRQSGATTFVLINWISRCDWIASLDSESQMSIHGAQCFSAAVFWQLKVSTESNESTDLSASGKL